MDIAEPTIGGNFSLNQIETAHIHALMKTKNFGEVAKIAGINAATLYRKRKKWGLTVQRNQGYEIVNPTTKS